MKPKIYAHQTIEGAFIMETDLGNFEVTNTYVKKTTLNGVGEPLAWDGLTHGIDFENAEVAMKDMLSSESIRALRVAVSIQIQDFAV
jgi:hypothetical protein